MSIVTKTGDKGTTGTFGGGRVSKDAPRIWAVGTIDELNAILGVALTEHLPDVVKKNLQTIQRLLFSLGADIATPLEADLPISRMETKHVSLLEEWIRGHEDILPKLSRFILPSGSRAGSLLHMARTVCRRAERHVVSLEKYEQINTLVGVYLNRLSDYLFVAARLTNKECGELEIEI